MRCTIVISNCLLLISPAFGDAKRRTEIMTCIAYYDNAARGFGEALSSFKTIDTSDGKLLLNQIYERATKLRKALQRIDGAEGIPAGTSEAAIKVEAKTIWPLMNPNPTETAAGRAEEALNRWADGCANLYKIYGTKQP